MGKSAKFLKHAKIALFVLLTLIWHYYRSVLIFDRSINERDKLRNSLGLRNNRLLVKNEEKNDGTITELDKNIPRFSENTKLDNEGEDKSAKVGTHLPKNEKKKQKKTNSKELKKDVPPILEDNKTSVENACSKCESCKSQDNPCKRKVSKFFSSINKHLENTNLDQHLSVNLSLKKKFLRYALYIVPLIFGCVLAVLTQSGCPPCVLLAIMSIPVLYENSNKFL